jgi:hypothetical protein
VRQQKKPDMLPEAGPGCGAGTLETWNVARGRATQESLKSGAQGLSGVTV